MAKAYVLYNPKAGNVQHSQVLENLNKHISDEKVMCDMTADESYEKLLSNMEDGDYAVVCGGDGTLNRFINKINITDINNDILYFPCGSGNDFAREFGKQRFDAPFSVKKYLEQLPTVTVNGTTSQFINGVGYGIDGYCCAVGDELRRKNKKIDYTAIAVKGLLFYYKPTSATVIVDGVEHSFKKVWIAPTMIGRHYGGGMIPTPEQRRDSGLLSTMIFHGSGKIKTLMIFPSIFKGEHVAKKKHVTVFEGKCITVKFDRPTFLQVDGETFWGVSEYTARIG